MRCASGIVMMIGLLACGGGSGNAGPNNPNNPGSLQGSATGGITATLSGNATFSVVPGVGCIIQLTNVGTMTVLQVIRPNVARPPNGNYSINGTATFVSGNIAAIGVSGISGSLTLTTSNTGTVAGTLQFTGTTSGSSGNVTVNLTFTATCLSGAGAGCG